jgi:hypothetical protein
MKVLNALRTSRDSGAEVSKERERGKGFAKDKICVMSDQIANSELPSKNNIVESSSSLVVTTTYHQRMNE